MQAILDAAEALLGERGYEAATLKAMGERTGIPVASVYHYFADRHQVETELAHRYLRELDERLRVALGRSEPGTLRDACDTVGDLYLAYMREHPSFGELWFSGRSSLLSGLAQTFDASQARQLWCHLTERALIRPDTPPAVVELAFEAADRLFDVAFRRSPEGDDATIDEASRLVAAYLGTYAPRH